MTRHLRLRTARLTLTPVAIKDAEALFAVYGDAEVMRLYLRRPCPDVVACRGIVRLMRRADKTGTGYRWSIRERATDAVVGALGYHAWDCERRTALLSYELVPSRRGRGYAQEAVAAVLGFGFGAMRLDAVEAEVHTENAPSIRLLERMGFQSETETAQDRMGTAAPFLRYRLEEACWAGLAETQRASRRAWGSPRPRKRGDHEPLSTPSATPLQCGPTSSRPSK